MVFMVSRHGVSERKSRPSTIVSPRTKASSARAEQRMGRIYRFLTGYLRNKRLESS
jgi:hypothetical protein